MNIATCSHTDVLRCEQVGRKTPDDLPHLLSLLEQQGDEQSRVADLASHVTWLVTQRLPVTAASPLYWSEEGTFADQVFITLTDLLQQGYRHLLLVPWGSRQNTGSLLEPTCSALSTVTGEAISRTEIALPQVHVDGVSARRAFEGLSSIHAQLSPLLESFPGWDRTWIRLEAGQVKIVLLCTSAWTVQPSQKATWELPTLKALTAAICPHQAEFMAASERSRWQRDGQIYARYLVSLLCAAVEFLQ